MRKNILLNVLTNFFVILLFLYISTFIGILLIILRIFYRISKKNYTGYYLVITGIIISIPQLFNYIDLGESFSSFLENEIYLNIYSMSNKLFIIGIILIIIEILINKAVNKIKTGISTFIKNEQNMSYEVNKENNLLIKEKQERAKTTHVVICPYCGADNILTGKIGKCKFCRKNLTKKEKSN